MSALTQSRSAGGLSTAKVGLSIVLLTESVFFATLLVAYFALRSVTAWPLQQSLARLAVPLANTAILAVSVVGAWRAFSSIRTGRVGALTRWLLFTLLLGLIFVAGQVYEFGRAGMRIDDQSFGAVFFTLMGFHAVHVLAGVVVLSLNLARARLGDFSSSNFEPVEIGAWFWTYVAAVWLVLFTALYLI